MINSIKETKIDLVNNLAIDHANKTITVTKQFQKASGKYGSKEYLVYLTVKTQDFVHETSYPFS